MIKKFKSDKPTFSLQQIVFQEIADIMNTALAMSETYNKEFQRSEIQQEVHDIIWNSEIPEGEVLHVLLYGSTGSGKSTAVFAEVFDILLAYPGSTALGVRRTYDQINDSIYPDVGEFTKRYQIPHSTVQKPPAYNLKNGSTFKMRSADSTAKGKTDKAEPLGGTKYTIAVLEEVDNIPEEYARTLPGRMRENKGCPVKVIFYLCNPPSQDHWVYKFFFVDNDPYDLKSNRRALHMPVEANSQFLPPGYIDNLYKDYKDYPQLFRRLVQGYFGPDIKGYPIYSKYFNKEIHVAGTEIWHNWNRNIPLILGFDFGFRRPAMVLCQDDYDTGQIRIYRAVMGDKILLDQFAKRELDRIERLFPGAVLECYIDPAGDTKDNQGRTTLTAKEILVGLGLRPKYRRHHVEYGINLIADYLSKSVPTREGSVPAILINPTGCDILVEGFQYGYCNEKEVSNDEIKPVKDGFYEHCQDCFRYVMVCIRKPATKQTRGQANRVYQGDGEWAPFKDGDELPMRQMQRRSSNGQRGGGLKSAISPASYGFSKKRRRR
jgi:phage terminase large subunit